MGSAHVKISKSMNKGTATGVVHPEPALIQVTYENDFESEPLWEIGKSSAHGKVGIGFWAETERDKWESKNFQTKPLIKGLFTEIERIESKQADAGPFVLIEYEGNKRWVNVGKRKPNQICVSPFKFCPNCRPRRKYLPDSTSALANKCENCGGELKTKKACWCEYCLRYDNAICYGKQFGVKGSARVQYRGVTLDLKLIAVREKRHIDGRIAGDWPYVGPGRYLGIVLASDKHKEHYLVPVIHLCKTEDSGVLIKGCWLTNRITGVKKKDKGKPVTSGNILIHPSNFPWKLEGCLALGHKFSNYGFESSEDSRKAVLDLLNMVWHQSSKDKPLKERADELFTELKDKPESKRLKFIIEVADCR